MGCSSLLCHPTISVVPYALAPRHPLAQLLFRLKHMKTELVAQEKAREAAKEAAAEGAEEDGQPAPKSPLKKRGLPGNSTVLPIRAVPWP